MSNGYGSYRTTAEADLAAYDASPPLLRWIERNTIAKWASVPLLKEWRRAEARGIAPHDIAREFANDIRTVERKHTRKHYGSAHPEAAAPPARGRK